VSIRSEPLSSYPCRTKPAPHLGVPGTKSLTPTPKYNFMWSIPEGLVWWGGGCHPAALSKPTSVFFAAVWTPPPRVRQEWPPNPSAPSVFVKNCPKPLLLQQPPPWSHPGAGASIPRGQRPVHAAEFCPQRPRLAPHSVLQFCI